MPLVAAIQAAGPKPNPLTASRDDKKNYAEKLSNEVAKALAAQLRVLGVAECQPDPTQGRERQFAGGIGGKKVDVSFATEVDGLILAISVKSISFPDRRTKNYQKNLTNRRGDLLAEATTLHQRFPYAVLGGLFLFDEGAAHDGTGRRASTFETANELLRAFDSRDDRANAVEKYEALGIVLYKAEPASYKYFDAGKGSQSRPLDRFLQRLLEKVAERNPDRFRFADGKLISRGHSSAEEREGDSDENP